MNLKLCAAALAGMLSTPLVAGELRALDDSELSDVTGQEGIALDVELRINTDASGAPLASLNDCSGVGNPCTLAVQFNNRLGGGGEWLVLKDTYGLLRINNLWLDAGETPLLSSLYPNPRRFLSQDGSTCLTGQGSAPNCTANGLPALTMTFPGSAGVFETDVNLSLNIGRMAVQYGAEVLLPGNDNNRSFVGIRIDDLIHDSARIDIDGSVSLIGF